MNRIRIAFRKIAQNLDTLNSLNVGKRKTGKLEKLFNINKIKAF